MARNDFGVKENLDRLRGVNYITCNNCEQPFAEELLNIIHLGRQTDKICSKCLPTYFLSPCRLDLIVDRKTKNQIYKLGQILVEKNHISHNKLTQVFLYSIRELIKKYKV